MADEFACAACVEDEQIGGGLHGVGLLGIDGVQMRSRRGESIEEIASEDGFWKRVSEEAFVVLWVEPGELTFHRIRDQVMSSFAAHAAHLFEQERVCDRGGLMQQIESLIERVVGGGRMWIDVEIDDNDAYA